jgi:UDPglucose 6-dehydrogenase
VIGIFGAGWVGLVTGACFAELGHEVVVRDIVPERIEALRAGQLPFHEPGLEELLERNRERLTFTLDVADLAGCEPLFVCVGTPPTYSGDADLSAVWTVVDELPPPEERSLLVMKSTVPVGTGEKVRAALEARGLAHVGYVSNPEFLAEGTAVRDFMQPDRVILGAYAEADGETVAALYEGIGLDHRLGPHFLRAGIGWGGSCFPKDGVALKQLASNSGYHFQLLNAVIEVNELQKRRVVGKLEKHLGKLRGKTVALLGLAFKPNTDDLREAPSLVLASRLLAEGAEVRAWDPVADARHLLQGVAFCDTVLDAVTGADAAVIVTEWDALRSLASDEVREAMRTPVIVDGRNLLDPETARAAGFTYEGIGRASSSLAELPETQELEPELER